MTRKPETAEGWWSTLFFAAAGAIVGIFLSTISHLLHDHRSLSSEEVIWNHFVPKMLAAMVAGAILFGGMSAIWNWLQRRS